jgi:hypothetical protein
MIRKISIYFSTIPAVFIDGTLYVLIALGTANSAALSTDMAAKYIDAQILFYIQWINGSMGASLLALKMFRSTAFAQHQDDKKKAGDTQFITKNNTGI